MANIYIVMILFWSGIFVKMYQISKVNGLKAMLDEKYRYHNLFGAYLLINVHLVLACALSHHGYNDHLMSAAIVAVILGTCLYIYHLIKEAMKGNPMAPLYALPYLVLVIDIAQAIYTVGLGVLHTSESRMIISLAFPFFTVLIDVTKKLNDEKKQ